MLLLGRVVTDIRQDRALELRKSLMPPPRISEGAEAARAAALQAEFNEKKWVWIPDEKEGYLGGWVIEEDGDIGEVVMATGGEVSKFTS